MVTVAQRYVIDTKLGEGGMGVVYRAHDRLTGEVVALKQVQAPMNRLLFQSQSGTDELYVALTTEFQTLAALRHPHIISVLDYGFDEQKQPFFTMTLLENPQNLLDSMRPLPLPEQIACLIQILQALAYLHQRGIIHRDLKPANVLLVDGQVKVLDFGLAMEHSAEQNVAGTLAYMAPEVLRGQHVSTASDLYAVGVIAYEVLVGHPPFDLKNINDLFTTEPDLTPFDSLISKSHPVVTDTTDPATFLLKPDQISEKTIQIAEVENEITMRLVDSQAIHPDTLPTETPRDNESSLPTLGSIVGKLLAKKPENRYQKAHDVIHDLSVAMAQPLPTESSAIRESFLQSAKFVGREQEFATLQTALHHALDSQGSVWLVGGESGVGKSRLLNELRTYALVNGVLVVRGQGMATGGLTFQLWRDVLPPLVLDIELNDLEAGVLQELVPQISELLGRPIPAVSELTGKEAQQRLNLTIQTVLQRQRQPVLLLLEDLQWVEESLLPIKHIMVHIQQMPLLIVGNYRHDEAPNLPDELPTAHGMVLPRLSDEAIAELSASMLGEAGRNLDVLSLMMRETEGNTFFMIEVARALAEEAGTLAGIGQAGLPAQVFTGGMAQLLQRRLERISPEFRPLLTFAAVAGRQIDLALLQHLVPDADIQAWLYQGQASAVLEAQEGRWQFAHDKLREAVIKELANRPALHQQVAEAIESLYDPKPYADVLMYHWQAAGNPAKELAYLLLVAEEMTIYSARYAQALTLLTHGLSLGNPPSQLFYLLGECEYRRANYAQAQTYYEDSLAKVTTEDMTVQVHTLNSLALLKAHLGNFVEATQHAEQEGLLARRANYLKGIAGSLTNLGAIADHQGLFAQAQTYYEEALSVWRTSGDQLGIARALSSLGSVVHSQGLYDESYAYNMEALTIRKRVGDMSGISASINKLAGLAYEQGRYAEAQAYFEESLVIKRTIGEQNGIAGLLANLGELLRAQAKYDQAEIYLQESLVLQQRIQDQRGIAMVFQILASVRVVSGRYDEAAAYYQESLTIKRTMGDPRGISASLNSLGILMQWQGKYAEAEAYYQESLTILKPTGHQHDIVITLLNVTMLQFLRQTKVESNILREMLTVTTQFKTIPLILITLIRVACWRLQQGYPEQAAEWFGFVANHPTYDGEVQEDAQPFIVEMQKIAPTEAMEVAQARGKQMTLEEAIARAFQELETESN